MIVEMTGNINNHQNFNEKIEQVKTEVDLRTLLYSNDAVNYGRYNKQKCINPEHTDSNPSMLVFPDGYKCLSCLVHGDAIDVMKLISPGKKFNQIVDELLSNPELRLTEELKEFALRKLNPSSAITNHLNLVKHPEGYQKFLNMGFTSETIRRFMLGITERDVRIEDDFEKQIRLSIPVYLQPELKQTLYRKLTDEQRGPKVFMEKEAGSWLFNVDTLKRQSTAFIVESYGDAMSLEQNGFPAVAPTSGAGGWSIEFMEYFTNIKKLYIVPNCDQAGLRMVQRLISFFGSWLHIVTLPFEKDSKKDVRDYFLEGHTARDFSRLVKASI